MNKVDNKKIIIILICIIVILIFVLIILHNCVKNKNQKNEMIERVNSYTSIEEFKSIEEVSTYLECDFIKQVSSKEENYDIDIYMTIKYEPYVEEQSYERYYDKLISYSAKVLKYQSFRIIDTKKNITVEIICDKQNETIKSKIINGETNYFAKHDSYNEINNIEETKETSFDTINSELLKEIIENEWKYEKDKIGTQESIFNQYDIFFDEGIKVKKIENKIFNIIFTKNYKGNIVNSINTSMSKEDIIKILGEPTFSDELFDLIGYKGKDIYLFYNSRNEISIYRAHKSFDTTKFAQIIDDYLENRDQDKLVKDLKEAYSDFDEYENSAQGTLLQYTLNGIQINFRKGISSGIQIYKNYSGIIYKDVDLQKLKNGEELPDNIFINNEDLVEKSEIQRLQNIYDTISNANIERLNEQNSNMQSNKFYTIKTKMNDGLYKIKFISIDKEYADCELRENIDYFIWIDDYNFIYSVKNKGIYLYNLKLRKYGKLVTGKDEEFKIIEYKDNILKYDEKSIKILN